MRAESPFQPLDPADPRTWEDLGGHPTYRQGDCFDLSAYPGDARSELASLRALALRIQSRWDVALELELLDDLTLYVTLRPAPGVEHSIHSGAGGQGYTLTVGFEGPGEEVDHFPESMEDALGLLGEVLGEGRPCP